MSLQGREKKQVEHFQGSLQVLKLLQSKQLYKAKITFDPIMGFFVLFSYFENVEDTCPVVFSGASYLESFHSHERKDALLTFGKVAEVTFFLLIEILTICAELLTHY